MSENEKNLINEITEAYTQLKTDTQLEPNVLLRRLSKEYNMSTVKIRKILITSGAFESKESIEISRLHSEGKSVTEISEITGLKKSAVNNYLPYTKSVYKDDSEPTLSNARVRKHREKKIMEDPQSVNYKQIPEHGIFFYSAGDLSVGFYLGYVKEYLLEYHPVQTLKEAIQAYNCYLFISNGITGKSWTEEEKKSIESNASSYKTNVARFLADNPSVVLQELNNLEYDYKRSILRMSVYFGILKKWDKETFFSILNENNIHHILEIKQYSETFPNEIERFLKNNIDIATEIILDNNTVNEFENPEKPKYYLPEKTDAKEKARILTKYINSENPSHAKLVSIMNMPSEVRNAIHGSSKELAQRLIDEKSKEFMESIDTGSISTDVIIEFSHGEKENKPEKNENGQFVVHYNLDTLDNNLTPRGIIKCLYSLFDVFDQQNGLVLLANKTREFSLTEHLMGPRSKSGYNLTFNQRFRAQMTIATLNLYYDYLNSKGIHLEKMLGKGFSELIKQEHGITDFGFELPVTDISYRFRAMHAASLIEELFNRLYLLEKKETIDQYKLTYCPPVKFSLLDSLLPDKYLYINDDSNKKRLVQNLQYLLFSSQHVFYVKKIMNCKEEIRCNLELLLRYDITKEEIPEYDRPKLDFLIKHKCITVVNKCLKPTKKTLPLKEIWDHGCVTTYRTTSDFRVLDELITEGWLIKKTSLLSRPEQNLLSFLYSNSKYSDAWALRNYYTHADLTELKEEQHKANYLWLLYIIIVLEMKFFEELDLLSMIDNARKKLENSHI